MLGVLKVGAVEDGDGVVAFALGGFAFDFQTRPAELEVVAIGGLALGKEWIGEVNLEIGDLAGLPSEGETQRELAGQPHVARGGGGAVGNQGTALEGPVFGIIAACEPLFEVVRATIDLLAWADAHLDGFDRMAWDVQPAGIG